MSCTLLTAPSLLRLGDGPTAPAHHEGSTRATAVLDHQHPALGRIDLPTGDDVSLVRAAHAAVQRVVRPVYALDETQPTSRTLHRGRGSCSQRMAVVESLARRHGVATRVRGLVVDGRFWRDRFRLLRPALPDRLLLAWPEFAVDGGWREIGSLFAPDHGSAPFTNTGATTLFDAVGQGRSALCTQPGSVQPGSTRPGSTHRCGAGGCSDPSLLSTMLLADLGSYPDRDTLFGRWGQNLPVLRRVADPVLSRWSAGGR